MSKSESVDTDYNETTIVFAYSDLHLIKYFWQNLMNVLSFYIRLVRNI